MSTKRDHLRREAARRRRRRTSHIGLDTPIRVELTPFGLEALKNAVIVPEGTCTCGSVFGCMLHEM